jgi:hypothetical protein
MKLKIASLILGVLAVAQMGRAQGVPQLLPPQLEKELAAHASDVTEVTLNKSLLGFASKVMSSKGRDDAAVKQLIDGLDGIYVRSYEFEKEGQYGQEVVERVRQAVATPEWVSLVHEQDRKHGETTDVLVKMINGQNHGMFVLSAEPRELTIVMILGPIRLEDLGKLKGVSGLGALGAVNGGKHKPGKDAKSDGKGDAAGGGK